MVKSVWKFKQNMAKSHKTCMAQAEIIDTFGTYHRLPRIFRTSASIMRHLVTTRAAGIGCMNKVHSNIPMGGEGKGKGHIGSREFIGEYLRHLLVKQ